MRGARWRRATPSWRPRRASACSPTGAAGRDQPQRAGQRCGAASTRPAARSRSARLANGTGAGVASPEDLGAYRLLLSLQDDDGLRQYCEDVLGADRGRARRDGDELLRSLESFLEHNGNWEAAARALFCHRHTLRYRMSRVEELTGRASTGVENRIEFWLALRGRELRGAAERRSVAQPTALADDGSVDHREGAAHEGRRPDRDQGDEYRVAMTPAGVRELTERGHEVLVQAGAGLGSGDRRRRTTPPRARRSLPDAAAVFAAAEMIVKVKEPQPLRGRAAASRGHILFTYLHLAADARADARRCAPPARPASPTRRSRTAAAGCRCWRR